MKKHGSKQLDYGKSPIRQTLQGIGTALSEEGHSPMDEATQYLDMHSILDTIQVEHVAIVIGSTPRSANPFVRFTTGIKDRRALKSIKRAIRESVAVGKE